MPGGGHLLIDNDAFILLAAAGLLQPAIQTLGLSGAALRLATLPFVIGRSKKIQKQYPADALIRAKLACAEIPELDSRPADHLLQRLAAVPEVDDGEAVLYGLVCERDDYLLLSSDKRAMVALATAEEIADLRARVAGRVICVEKVFDRLLDAHGLDHVAQAVLPIRESNSTLRVLFSNANCSDPAGCRAAIASYVAELEVMVGVGFLY